MFAKCYTEVYNMEVILIQHKIQEINQENKKICKKKMHQQQKLRKESRKYNRNERKYNTNSSTDFLFYLIHMQHD